MAEIKRNSIPLFSERLEELVGDLSYEEFGKRCGISRQSVGFYLHGKRLPDAATLRDIAYANDVTSDWLLGLSNKKTADPDIQNVVRVTHLDEEFIYRFVPWIEKMPRITSHFLNILSACYSFFPLIEELLNLYISDWNARLNPSEAQDSNETNKVPMLFRTSSQKYEPFEPDVKVSFFDVVNARVQQYASNLAVDVNEAAKSEAELAYYAFSDFAGFDIDGFMNGGYERLYGIFDSDFLFGNRYEATPAERFRFERFIADNRIPPDTRKRIEREFNISDEGQRGNTTSRSPSQSQEEGGEIDEEK